MTITDILSEYGSKYVSSGQGVQDIQAMLRTPSVTESYFPLVVTNNTQLERAISSFSRVLQPFHKNFTATGAATFKPSTIALKRIKIDVQETPDDLVQSWLGFLSSNNLSRTEWLFTRWWMSEIIKQASNDWEINEVFAGEYDAPDGNTAGAAGTAIDGIREKIRAAVTATTATSIATGAASTDPLTFVEQVEAFYKTIPALVRRELDAIFMSEDLALRYKEGMRLKYNSYYAQASNATIIDTRVEVVGLPSMVGSGMIFTSPKWNRVTGVKWSENQSMLKMENVDRTIKAYTDFHKGVGFWIPQYIYVNDQDLS
jgi:hypothetical protein